jgi:signal transduction histidine kinase
VEELVFLNRVGRTVTSSLNLEQILTTVLEETTLVLRTEAGSILLLDEESSELVFEAAVGPRAEGIKGLRFPLGQGIAGWAAREGQRLLVPNAKEDPRFYPGIDGVTSFVTKSVLAVPLKVKGKVIGVIEAVNKIEDDFSQADVALLSSIAQPAAIAIENARLYEELQNRMEELKRTQAQLIQSAKLAAIGELAAGVAHEINNPLTSIVGFTRLLLQEIDDDAMKEDLQIIDREAARTKAIVRGLLDFARQREPQLEQVDVNEIVQTTMALIRHQAKCARVAIKESYDETLPLVSLDADQIKQVFLNMMTNAIQAMPKGGELKVVTARRSQAQSPDGSTGSPQRLAKGMDSADYVVVEFHDTGTGISMEDLPRIFDPFFTTKEVGQGTGLGLSISHSIVEKHGGKIKVESKVGRGSTFTVMLPVTEGEG